MAGAYATARAIFCIPMCTPGGVLGGRRSTLPEEILTDWRQHGITATTYMRLQPTGNQGSDLACVCIMNEPLPLAAIRHCC
jgi:hypothetical protein